ncbi:hypothetical protein EVAR_84632_1 [Eumeta japonica]|uniref:Uncharacterized protein n=1 Tax=Eumeta variegata TaxID=151549 RepID=A0A4C1UZ36_EUMVA|nr:hypothetical protein EVAR_84632_1 [Eumeta japonica]
MKTVTSIIRLVKDAKVSKLAVDWRSARSREERLAVLIQHHELSLLAVVRELIRVKNAALRRASAYPTPEYKSRARALQRKVKERVREFRNNKWSDLLEEISPSHIAYWSVAKALKSDRYVATPALKKPDNTYAVDDREKSGMFDG